MIRGLAAEAPGSPMQFYYWLPTGQINHSPAYQGRVVHALPEQLEVFDKRWCMSRM
jgi:hypothetical protein